MARVLKESVWDLYNKAFLLEGQKLVLQNKLARKYVKIPKADVKKLAELENKIIKLNNKLNLRSY